jgi:predicted transcriptional regulator
MMLGRALWQLHSAGMRSARCVAAVVANSLDDLVTFAVEQSDVIDMAASVKPEVTQKVMEVLFASAVGVEGLEDSAGKMEAALAGEPISASEVLLGLLTAMIELTFSARVSFLEALYTGQEERIDGLFDMAQPFLAMLPPVPAEHRHVICDGCDQAPLRGPRFKCTSLPDFDLCARCFAEKDSSCGGKCNGHEFETITSCKGKGKGKGTGKWKGKRDDAEQPATDAQCKREAECKGRRCTSQSCEFHEPPRDKLSTPDAKNFADEPPAPNAAAAADDKASSPHFDVSFPVALGDGQHATLYWNLGDDPQQVAEAFVAQHGVLPEELPTVLRFVEQCMAGGARQPECKESPAAPDGAAAADDKASSPHFDVSFPVAVGDGHHVTLYWNLGDDPQQVAQAFVAQHGVLPEELPTVLRFVEQCIADGARQPK